MRVPSADPPGSAAKRAFSKRALLEPVWNFSPTGRNFRPAVVSRSIGPQPRGRRSRCASNATRSGGSVALRRLASNCLIAVVLAGVAVPAHEDNTVTAPRICPFSTRATHESRPAARRSFPRGLFARRTTTGPAAKNACELGCFAASRFPLQNKQPAFGSRSARRPLATSHSKLDEIHEVAQHFVLRRDHA